MPTSDLICARVRTAQTCAFTRQADRSKTRASRRAVFTSNGHLGTAATFDVGFRPAIVSSAVLSIVGAMSALAVRSQRGQDARELLEEPRSVAVTRHGRRSL